MAALLGDILDGLYQASFRGVEFHVPDTRLEVGRRIQRVFFPGLDTSIHQDLGAFDGPIAVTGLIIGDDYVLRAEALRQAFRTAGPGTFVHPWLGEMQVVLARPATISLDERELRVARITAEFEPWSASTPLLPDTLGQVLAVLGALRTRVRAFLSSVLAPPRLAVAVVGAATFFIADCVATWNAVVLGLRGAAGLLPVLAGPFTALADAGSALPGSGYADAVTDGLAALPAAIAAAAVPLQAPAIGPGGDPQPDPACTPTDAATLLLSGAAALGSLDDPAPVPALTLAARALAVVEAVAAASDIAYESQQQARAWAQRLDAAVAAVAAAAAAQAAALPQEAGSLWRGLIDLRSAVAADYNARIGRLPAVVTLTPPGAAPVWLLAQHVAGDDPARMLALYADLVSRNGIRHPALAPAAPLEMLA